MNFNTNLHHRRSIRLQGYDYAQAGAYFVTICTQNREWLFGEVVDGEMRLSDAGQIVANEWINTLLLRPNVELDGWVVMPNHLHGIVVIVESYRGDVGVLHAPMGIPTLRSPSQTIGAIVRGFKSTVTKQINLLRKQNSAVLWQRNYYEHIIRDESELNEIREYIQNNPLKWEMDSLFQSTTIRRVS